MDGGGDRGRPVEPQTHWRPGLGFGRQDLILLARQSAALSPANLITSIRQSFDGLAIGAFFSLSKLNKTVDNGRGSKGVPAKRSDERRDPRSANAVDQHIGQRVRARRLEIHMSQEGLAEAIGVTFQQIQKYEKGVNRISASTLIRIAKALGVGVAALLPKESTPHASEQASLLDEPALQDIAQVLPKLNADGRRLLVDLARALSSYQSLRASARK